MADFETDRIDAHPSVFIDAERFGRPEQYGDVNPGIRGHLFEIVGGNLSRHVQHLEDYGITRLTGFFSETEIARMQSDVERWHGTKEWNQDRYMGFDGPAPEEGYLPTSEALSEAVTHPSILAVVAAALGQHPRLSTVRTFSVDPIEPYQRRASIWHHDGHWTRDGLKVMVLLSDVPEEGQAMRYCAGTNKLAWPADSLEQTLFTNQFADLFDQYVCSGKAGDVFVFNPYALHRAVRNMTARRDVIIFDFQPGHLRNYPLPGLHPAVAAQLSEYQQAVYRVRDGGNVVVREETFAQDMAAYRQRMQHLASLWMPPLVQIREDLSRDVDENIALSGNRNANVVIPADTPRHPKDAEN